MPNHCSNRLTVSGKPEEVRRFVDFACPDNSEDQPLDYNKLCPMPDSPSSQLEESQACYLNEFKAHIGLGRMRATPFEEYESLKDSDDPQDVRRAKYLLREAWYAWCILNWGTKWNCYDGGVDESRIETDGVVVYHFASAWSPPIGVITAGAEKFDSLTFKLEYAEPGCGFSGVLEATGDVYDDECVDNVLGTEYGQELYQESFDEAERLENAENQDEGHTD
jgi:hypothetical protein